MVVEKSPAKVGKMRCNSWTPGVESGGQSHSGFGTSQLSVLIDRKRWREGKGEEGRDVQAKQPVTSYNGA